MLRAWLLGGAVLLASACDGGGGPMLAAIPQQDVRVNAELTIALAIDNPDGRAVDVRIEDPMIAGFDRVVSISATPTGATFRWVPLSSHVGMHELTFVLTSADGGTEYDRESALVNVLAADDAAPVFVRPGPGGTYDLTVNPCVTFDVEVRDDDDTDVEIGSRATLPEQATLVDAESKRAMFDWCPTPDQIAASERWTIQLYADDGEHPPVEKDYIVVLRAGPGRDDCPGQAPAITIGSPAESERVTSGTGYAVAVDVNDDMGLRDAPLLYYTTTAPEDPTKPDVTQFDQATFEDAGDGSWTARIPSLGLADGEELAVYYLVSATDNDDPAGSLCDHRTDSALVTFIAIGGTRPDGTLEDCDRCTASTECASGICATTAGGGRCVVSCAGSGACESGTCGATVTTEGATRAACGPPRDLCEGGGGSCTEDSREEDDSIASATVYSTALADGQICADDSDYFAIGVDSGERITVTVDDFVHADGDLDLRLLTSTGTILGSSASVRDVESVSYCNGGSTVTLYAHVSGFMGSQNGYSFSADVAPDPGGCCAEDAGEPDDTRGTARDADFVSDMAEIEGTACASDDDWIEIPMSGAGTIDVSVIFEHDSGDIDIQLYGPTGTVIDSSTGTTDEETISATVSGGGTYTLRIYAYGAGNAEGYLDSITRTSGASCTDTGDCPVGTVCEASGCGSDACTSAADCPASHSCPTAGPPGAMRHCTSDCAVNADCRTGEACKWFPEGRGCGVTGSGTRGAACDSYTDCGVQRSCVDWPGGYCARQGCASNGDCETDTYCVSIAGENVCALSCVVADCREAEGYTCELTPTLGGTDRFVCIP